MIVSPRIYFKPAFNGEFICKIKFIVKRYFNPALFVESGIIQTLCLSMNSGFERNPGTVFNTIISNICGVRNISIEMH